MFEGTPKKYLYCKHIPQCVFLLWPQWKKWTFYNFALCNFSSSGIYYQQASFICFTFILNRINSFECTKFAFLQTQNSLHVFTSFNSTHSISTRDILTTLMLWVSLCHRNLFSVTNTVPLLLRLLFICSVKIANSRVVKKLTWSTMKIRQRG